MVTGKRDELRLFLLTRRAPARKEVHDHPTAFEAGHLEALAGDRRHRTVRRGRDPGRWLIHEGRARLLGCVSARREYCDETRNDGPDAPGPVPLTSAQLAGSAAAVLVASTATRPATTSRTPPATRRAVCRRRPGSGGRTGSAVVTVGAGVP